MINCHLFSSSDSISLSKSNAITATMFLHSLHPILVMGYAPKSWNSFDENNGSTHLRFKPQVFWQHEILQVLVPIQFSLLSWPIRNWKWLSVIIIVIEIHHTDIHWKKTPDVGSASVTLTLKSRWGCSYLVRWKSGVVNIWRGRCLVWWMSCNLHYRRQDLHYRRFLQALPG